MCSKKWALNAIATLKNVNRTGSGITECLPEINEHIQIDSSAGSADGLCINNSALRAEGRTEIRIK